MTRQIRGFTLLEVLLATAMVAALGLALYSAMSIGFRARRSAYAQVHTMRAASIAVDIAQQDLQSALPPTGTLSGPFVGQNDSVEFYALGRDVPWMMNPAGNSSMAGTLGNSSGQPVVLGNDSSSDASSSATPVPQTAPLSDGPRKVQLLLSSDGASTTLVRRVERNLLAQGPTQPTEETLARNVVAFAVRYYDGSAWAPQWDSSQQDDALPVAVELTIDLAGDGSGGNKDKPYRVRQIVPLACRPAGESNGSFGLPQ